MQSDSQQGTDLNWGLGPFVTSLFRLPSKMVELNALSFRSTEDAKVITNIPKKHTVACCTIVLESDQHLIDPDLRIILLRFEFKLDIQAQDRRIFEKFWLLFGTSISERFCSKVTPRMRESCIPPPGILFTSIRFSSKSS